MNAGIVHSQELNAAVIGKLRLLVLCLYRRWYESSFRMRLRSLLACQVLVSPVRVRGRWATVTDTQRGGVVQKEASK